MARTITVVMGDPEAGVVPSEGHQRPVNLPAPSSPFADSAGALETYQLLGISPRRLPEIRSQIARRPESWERVEGFSGFFFFFFFFLRTPRPLLLLLLRGTGTTLPFSLPRSARLEGRQRKGVTEGCEIISSLPFGPGTSGFQPSFVQGPLPPPRPNRALFRVPFLGPNRALFLIPPPPPPPVS